MAALDPSGTATDNNIGDAFEDGVLVTAEGRVTIKPFGLVGHQLLGGGWSNKERISLVQDPANIGRTVLNNQFPRLVDPGPVLARFLERFFPALLVPTQPLNREDDTWTIYYNFDQYLWSPEGVPDRGIGVFFRFGVSDGRANPIKYAYNVGIGAKGLWLWRPCDTFGIGWAHTELSDTLSRSCASDSSWGSAMRTPSSCITMPRSRAGSARRWTCKSSSRRSPRRSMAPDRRSGTSPPPWCSGCVSTRASDRCSGMPMQGQKQRGGPAGGLLACGREEAHGEPGCARAVVRKGEGMETVVGVRGAMPNVAYPGTSNGRNTGGKPMTMQRWKPILVRCLLVSTSVLALAGCAERIALGPEAVQGKTPDGTIEMHEVQAAYIGSGSGGNGVLFFRGREYPFDVGGLGVGGIGVSTIEATGAVLQPP